MLKIPEKDLAEPSLEYLRTKQAAIDELATFTEQVEKGKSLWKSKSKKHFGVIRNTLAEMCVGKRRCNYCEDSAADEVEHIKPKDLYPGSAFCWENYLFACGPCNGRKNNHFAVFSGSGESVELSEREDKSVAPPDGNPVFIDPRTADPMEYMILDLETFLFVPKPGISPAKTETRCAKIVVT